MADATTLASGIVLAIDTASVDASLALLRGDDVLATRVWRVETTVSRELLEHLDALLVAAEVTRDRIAVIAVAAGPGQYGPLRIGIATAQGLALALEVPLAGVSRLEADALPHLQPGRTVIAVHDAGRSGVAWAAYALDAADAAPRCLVEARLDEAAVVVRTAPREATWCGELTDDLRAARDAEGRSGDTDAMRGALFPDEAAAASEPRAVAVARLARLHEAYGDPALVDAIYLRPPPITQPRATGT